MADSYRCHGVIEAPVEDVWAVVSDPQTHPEWWPDVEGVELAGELDEGDEYTRSSRRFGFMDLVDSIWVAERLEHLQEAHFRCTVSGSYLKVALTPAEKDTFVEFESGMLPTNSKWRVLKVISGPYLRSWIRDMLEALPAAVEHHREPSPR